MDLVLILGVFRAGRGVDSGGRRPSGGPWPEWKQSLKSFFGIEREEGRGSLTLQIKACISLSSSSFFHSAPNNTLMDYWCARSVWVHDRSIWGGTLRDLPNKHRNGSFQSKTRSTFMPSHQMAILFYGFEAALYVGGFFALATWPVTWKQFSFYDILHLSLKGEILCAAPEQVQVKYRGSRRPEDIEPEVLRIPKYPARPEEVLQ